MATTPTTLNGPRDPHSISFQIADGQTVYHGRFAGLTDAGDLDNYAPAVGTKFAGIVETPEGLTQATGNSSAAVPPRASVSMRPRILKRYPVTGATGRGDIGEPVYATDNETLDLAAPANGDPAGVVTEYHSGTECDVLIFGFGHSIQQ